MNLQGDGVGKRYTNISGQMLLGYRPQLKVTDSRVV
jgi:hypothetical protein